jgi:hypothetical protein
LAKLSRRFGLKGVVLMMSHQQPSECEAFLRRKSRWKGEKELIDM